MMTSSNPVLTGIAQIQQLVDLFKENARQFYRAVVMSVHSCPECEGPLSIVAPSRAQCKKCGHELDPTVQFQRSPCCNALLAMRRTHYACSTCGAVVQSKFIFDETVFDAQYFRENMSRCRERKRRQREELRFLLAASRSNDLRITDIPEINTIDGLAEALDSFVGDGWSADIARLVWDDGFQMETYRQLILSQLDGCVMTFDGFPTNCENTRLDRPRRFTTLIFMEHASEVWLEQRKEEILVRQYEANIEG